jgi:hypothetical protein
VVVVRHFQDGAEQETAALQADGIGTLPPGGKRLITDW